MCFHDLSMKMKSQLVRFHVNLWLVSWLYHYFMAYEIKSPICEYNPPNSLSMSHPCWWCEAPDNRSVMVTPVVLENNPLHKPLLFQNPLKYLSSRVWNEPIKAEPQEVFGSSNIYSQGIWKTIPSSSSSLYDCCLIHRLLEAWFHKYRKLEDEGYTKPITNKQVHKMCKFPHRNIARKKMLRSFFGAIQTNPWKTSCWGETSSRNHGWGTCVVKNFLGKHGSPFVGRSVPYIRNGH